MTGAPLKLNKKRGAHLKEEKGRRKKGAHLSLNRGGSCKILA